MFSPVVSVSVTWSEVSPCDSDSVLRQISFSQTTTQDVTCNGVIVTTADGSYDAIINKPNNWGHGGHGGSKSNCPSAWGSDKITIKLTNYTQIYTYSNGKLISKKYFDYLMTWLILIKAIAIIWNAVLLSAVHAMGTHSGVLVFTRRIARRAVFVRDSQRVLHSSGKL